MSDWDSYESELDGVLNHLDGLMEEMEDVGKEADMMIETNCKKAESLKNFIHDKSSVIKNPVAPVALQSRHKIRCPKDRPSAVDMQILLTSKEQTQSPSFYNAKVVPNKVSLANDEKSAPLKATKRASKKGKSRSTENETGQLVLSKQSLQKPEGFNNKNCTDNVTKDALPPIIGLNRTQKYIQAREQIFSTPNHANDHQTSSKKRMPKTGTVHPVQTQEKKVLRTTLDYCEARLSRSGYEKSAELPSFNKRPQINNRLGEDMAGFSGGRKPRTPLSDGHNGTTGRDRCSVSLMDTALKTDIPCILPMLEPNASLAAPNAPFVLPSSYKQKKVKIWSEVPELPPIAQHLPVIMPNRIQPKKQDSMPNTYVTWWPKNAGSLRAQKLDSVEVVESSENSIKRKMSQAPLLPNKQNASQFLRKQNKKTTHHRYF